MLRYIKKLESKDLSMVHSMISLGSCTMKLNATTEMIPVTWPEMGHMHPFAPSQPNTRLFTEIITNLENWLKEITGFTGVSLQPNSGAQGEYAGLLVIRAYHQNRGDHQPQHCVDSFICTRHKSSECSHGRYGSGCYQIGCRRKN